MNISHGNSRINDVRMKRMNMHSINFDAAYSFGRCVFGCRKARNALFVNLYANDERMKDIREKSII